MNTFQILSHRWRDKKLAEGYDHKNEERKSLLTKSILGRMTKLESSDLKASSDQAYKVLEQRGLKVKFKKVENNNIRVIRESHTGRGRRKFSLACLPQNLYIFPFS